MNAPTQKLRVIEGVWRHHIWDSRICREEVRFNEEAKTNYIGSLLGYFSDTFEIFDYQRKNAALPEIFSHTVTFLQAIYLQQDFVIELLTFFKTGIAKNETLKDPDCSIIREIRNELIGHPISRRRGELQCMTLFSYRTPNDKIEYLRYHKDNGFKFESSSWKIDQLLQHHTAFLDRYLGIIISRLKEILMKYSTQIASLEMEIIGMDFRTMLDRVEEVYEPIFDSSHAYEKTTLLQIHSRAGQHPRYSHFIGQFKSDLAIALHDTQESIMKIVKPEVTNEATSPPVTIPEVRIIYPGTVEAELAAKTKPLTFHYEIGKLTTNRSLPQFDMYRDFLVSKCPDNKIVLTELGHMRQNLTNDAEYFPALRFISHQLKEE